MSIFDLVTAPIFGEQLQERAPIAQDTITELALAYEATREASGGDCRAGALALLERLRDDLDGPPIIGPSRQRERLSRRTKRKLKHAIDRIIEQGRAA